MKIVITGYSKITSISANSAFLHFTNRIRKIRPVHELDTLIVSAIGELLVCAGVTFPIGNDTIGLYIGIDDSIEEIKNKFFTNIVKDGMMGVSPLLFPLTSPNALAAQVSIAFDIRGECITFPIQDSIKDTIDYGSECIFHNHIPKAIVGGIIENKTEQLQDRFFSAEFLFLERIESAIKRKQLYVPLSEVMQVDKNKW